MKVFLLLIPVLSYSAQWKPKYQKNKELKKFNPTVELGVVSKKKLTKAPILSKISSLELSKKTNSEDIMKDLSWIKNKYNNPKLLKTDIPKLKDMTVHLGTKSVPVLIETMKKKSLPDQNRWVATFMLGRVMGKKASAYLAGYVSHPNFMLRLASLKTLLAIKEVKYANVYRAALKDKSLIVKLQALSNIRDLKLKKYAPSVFSMMFDESNYSGGKGTRKRTEIIKSIIDTLAILDFKQAKKPFAKLIQNKKYDDLFPHLNTYLSGITGKFPGGSKKSIRKFWKTEI